MLDTLFSVGAGIRRLEALALKLGSDVPFFLHDAPQLCSGRGEVMRPAEIDLKGYWMVLVKPAICIPTAEAYAGITPRFRKNRWRNASPSDSNMAGQSSERF